MPRRRGNTDIRRVKAQVSALPDVVAAALTAEVAKGLPRRMGQATPKRTGRMSRGWKVTPSGRLRVRVGNDAFYWGLVRFRDGRDGFDIVNKAVQEEARAALPRAIAIARRSFR